MADEDNEDNVQNKHKAHKSRIRALASTIRKSSAGLPTAHAVSPHEKFSRRDARDAVHVRSLDEDLFDDIGRMRAKRSDSADIIHTYPSYSKVKIPLEMVCIERLAETRKRYEEQFQYEIDELINYMSSAREACYFVRIVSYTSLWPPYHSKREVDNTSDNFYNLTKSELKRYRKIMSE